MARSIGYMSNTETHVCMNRTYAHVVSALQHQPKPILPSSSDLAKARSSLASELPDQGLGIEKTTTHLLENITPALNQSSLSPNFYGFVTGGVTPAARIADCLVSLYDQNPLVYMPDQTIASDVEDKALRLLLDLLRFDQDKWSGVFTTGATAANMLGLACGREYMINGRIKSVFGEATQLSVGSLGLIQACAKVGIEDIHIYTTMGHSSLYKASSILGLGRSCVKDLGASQGDIDIDLRRLERELEASSQNSVSVVVVSCGEVNTGLFATHSYDQVRALRLLCDKHGAWLHIDGAFGLFARLLNNLTEFETVAGGGEGLELADSIASDAHKLLNMPYDCGFFFCRYPDMAEQVFKNPNASYLNTGNTGPDSVQSPLNIGIENSRRFRGLPVYTSLVAYGRTGYQEMLMRQVRFARAVALHFYCSSAFELLPQSFFTTKDLVDQNIFIIVLFRAKDSVLNSELVRRINTSSRMYVSGTLWNGQPASRIAVSNWQVDPERDLHIVKTVLEDVLSGWRQAS